MKALKKILSTVMLASLLVAGFASCNNSKDGKDDTPDAPSGIDISGYKIVRSESASDDIVKFTAAFKQKIFDYTKADLSVSDDYLENAQSADGVKEILIGETNRTESSDAAELLSKAPDSGYTISATEDKIVILGKTEAATIRAMKYFLMTYAAASDADNYVSLEVGKNDNGKVNLDSIVFDNFAELITEYKSTVYEPDDKWFDGKYSYPTMVRLYHNGDKNGTLLASCESGESGYPILRSTDDGKTWEKVTLVKDNLNSGYTCNWMPMLYELPVDMGEYKAGTVILAATSRDTGSSQNFNISTITLYASTDAGETWNAFCNVDLGGGQKYGVWEPFLIYEEERGRLYCFYSDDSDPEHDQKLVYKYTTDLKNWVGEDGAVGVNAAPKEAVACSDSTLRPGMISIAKMGNGKYIMTYEMVGISGLPVYAKTTDDLDDWGDISDYGTQVITEDGISFGSSAWCAWTPEGGECGTLIVQSKRPIPTDTAETEGAKMLLSFDYGKTYVAIDNPIPIPTKSTAPYIGYSPFLVFSEDGKTLYYLNNPAFGHGFCEHIVLAKIKIW